MLVVPYDEDIVPYTVWGSECKVVLRLEVGLKFHGSSIDLTGATVAKTSWVTYAFESERGK